MHAFQRVFFSLFFLVNMASCAQINLLYGAEVYFCPTEDVCRFGRSPHTHFGLFVTYFKNPVKNKQKSSFCYLQWAVDFSNCGRKLIEVTVGCDFSAAPPAFIVAKRMPDWVGCADPLLRVEFQEEPLGTTTLSEALVTKNAVKYPLPFVAGEDPQLNVFCEDSKATIVFDFGPNAQKSTTIDFLHWAKIFNPPIDREPSALSPEMERMVWEKIAISQQVYARADYYENKGLMKLERKEKSGEMPQAYSNIIDLLRKASD